MEDLPTEMVLKICKNLKFDALCKLHDTCSRLGEIIETIPRFKKEYEILFEALHLDNVVFSSMENDRFLKARHTTEFKEKPHRIYTVETLMQDLQQRDYKALYLGKSVHNTDMQNFCNILGQHIDNVYISWYPRCFILGTCFCYNGYVTSMKAYFKNVYVAPDLELYFNEKFDWTVVTSLRVFLIKGDLNSCRDEWLDVFVDDKKMLTGQTTLGPYVVLRVRFDIKKGKPTRFMSEFLFLRKLLNLKNLIITTQGCFFGHEPVCLFEKSKQLDLVKVKSTACKKCTKALMESCQMGSVNVKLSTGFLNRS